jgi:hypothetical protein
LRVAVSILHSHWLFSQAAVSLSGVLGGVKGTIEPKEDPKEKSQTSTLFPCGDAIGSVPR